MGVLDPVVLGFRATGIAGQPAGLPQRREQLLSPSEQFVDVALMPGVEDDRIMRGVEDPVQGDGELDDTKVRTKMPAGATDIADQEGPDLARESRELIGGQFPQVSRTLDRLQKWHPRSLRRALTTC